MIYLDLFLSFLMIGFTSFGGMSMIPLINDQMLSRGWMTSSEVADIVAIAEMTPGPLGINCATFAGARTAGIPGAVVASFGVLVPSLTLTLAAAIFLVRFKKSKTLGNAMFLCSCCFVSNGASRRRSSWLRQWGSYSARWNLFFPFLSEKAMN